MPLNLRSLLQRLAVPVSFLAMASGAHAGVPTGWNEAVNGDFSNNGLAPTVVALAPGINTVVGTTGRAVTGGPVDLDYFTITIPTGHVLDAMEVLPGTLSVGDGSFMGLMSGNTFTVSPNTPSAEGLLGWTLFGEGNVGGDLLLYMAAPAFGSTGYTPPLQAGNYAFWVQETGVGNAQYAFTMAITPVPEPASALMLLLGGVALVGARSKRHSYRAGA